MTYDLQAGDAGCVITLTVKDSVTGLAKDISEATVKKFYYKEKLTSRTPTEVTAVFSTDGTDGKLYYETLATTFPPIDDEAHYYYAQAYVEIGSIKIKSDRVVISVGPNL